MAAKNAVTLTAYRDGPLLVRGPCEFVDGNGQSITRRTGPWPVPVWQSRLQPLCDGTHKLIGFRAPAEHVVIDDN